jgi:16S rRNA (cytosine1402-N4)-methyltransferase
MISLRFSANLSLGRKFDRASRTWHGARVAADFAHTPVLLGDVREALLPALACAPAPATLLDLTVGGGGHALALAMDADAAGVRCHQLLFDRDPAALAAAGARLAAAPGTREWIHAAFSGVARVLAERGIPQVAAILADLGVSSHQLDEPTRGFSFRADAPLDMRMDPTRGPTAAELIATSGAPQLAAILREHGDEPDAERIAQAIASARPTTTAALAMLVSQAMSGHERRKLGARVHPATRTFQALRIAVNGEHLELAALLRDAPGLLHAGGRLAVITFHSAEDRAVKLRFRELTRVEAPPRELPVPAHELPQAAFFEPSPWRGGRGADADELARNPRARSAKLRVIERRAGGPGRPDLAAGRRAS